MPSKAYNNRSFKKQKRSRNSRKNNKTFRKRTKKQIGGDDDSHFNTIRDGFEGKDKNQIQQVCDRFDERDKIYNHVVLEYSGLKLLKFEKKGDSVTFEICNNNRFSMPVRPGLQENEVLLKFHAELDIFATNETKTYFEIKKPSEYSLSLSRYVITTQRDKAKKFFKELVENEHNKKVLSEPNP